MMPMLILCFRGCAVMIGLKRIFTTTWVHWMLNLCIRQRSTSHSLERDFCPCLQDHVSTQCAEDWRTLWRDRRDLNRFWTLWAVLIIGTLTIFLGGHAGASGGSTSGTKFSVLGDPVR
jgi:hypothetical protein